MLCEVAGACLQNDRRAQLYEEYIAYRIIIINIEYI